MVCPHCNFEGEMEYTVKKKGNKFAFFSFIAFAVASVIVYVTTRETTALIMGGISIYVITILMQNEKVYTCNRCKAEIRERELR